MKLRWFGVGLGFGCLGIVLIGAAIAIVVFIGILIGGAFGAL